MPVVRGRPQGYASAVTGDPDKHAPPSEATPLRIAGSWLQALTEGSKEVVALLDGDGTVQ